MDRHDSLITWREVEPYLDRAFDLESDPAALETWLTVLAISRPDLALAVRILLAERDVLNANGFLVQPPLTRAGMLARSARCSERNFFRRD